MLKYNDKIQDIKIDSTDLISQVIEAQVQDDKDYKKCKEVFGLYPFAKFVPFKINNSFYGRSDIKSLIPIQKGINFGTFLFYLSCIRI